MSQVNIVFFNVGDYVPLVDDLERFYANNPKYHVERINNAAEVIQYMSTTQGGIFLFKVTGKKDLQDSVGILKALKKISKQGLLKAACFSTIKNKKVESVLAKYGCMDILEPDIKAKTISFKMDFWSKPILAQLQKMEKAEELKMNASKKSSAKKEDKKEDFKETSPLELQSDFWIHKNKNDYKKILRRYLVKMLGPSPFIGSWVEVQTKPGDKQQTWRFALKDPGNEDYIIDQGAWYFYGAKPEFDWKIQRWNFPSEFPHLYFYTKEGKSYSRFKYKGDHVEFCSNSQFALMREEMILETCDSKFNFEGNGSDKEDSENLDGESETDEFGNLEGKGSEAEELSDMKGKGGSAEELGGAPLSGKSSTDELGGDPLSGKGSAADQLNDLDNGDKKHSTDHIENDPLGGKSSTDELGGDPLSGKGSAADQLNDLDNGDKKHSTDHIENDPLGGKSSTDELGGDPLSGKGSAADQLNDLDNGDKKHSTDHIENDPLGGKSSTDELGGDPLSGKGSAADQFDDLKNEKAKEAAETRRKKATQSLLDELQKNGIPLEEVPLNPDGTLDLDNPVLANVLDELIQNGVNPKDIAINQEGEPLPISPNDSAFLEELAKEFDIEEDVKPDNDLAKILDELQRNGINPESLSFDEDGNLDSSDEKLANLLDDLKSKGLDTSKLQLDENGELPQIEANRKNSSSDDFGFAQTETNKGINKASTLEELEEQVKNKNLTPDEEDFYSEKKKQLEALRKADGGVESYLQEAKDKKNRERELAEKDAQNIAKDIEAFKDKKKAAAAAAIANLRDGNDSEENHKNDSMESALDGDLTSGSKPNLKGLSIEGTSQVEESKAQGTIETNDVSVSLESGELKVVLKQKTEVGNDITFLCDFEDFYQDELITLCPKNSLAAGTEVSAEVSLVYNGKKVKVECRGVIEEVEDHTDSQDLLAVKITEISNEKYNTFMVLYHERQGSINDFMELAKGY